MAERRFVSPKKKLSIIKLENKTKITEKNIVTTEFRMKMAIIKLNKSGGFFILNSDIFLIAEVANALLTKFAPIFIVERIIINCPKISWLKILAAKTLATNMANLPIEFPTKSQKLLDRMVFIN